MTVASAGGGRVPAISSLALPAAAAVAAAAGWAAAGTVVVAAAAGLAGLGLASLWAGRRRSARIARLRAAVEALAAGDIHVSIPELATPDAVGALGRAVETLRRASIEADARGAEVRADKETSQFESQALGGFAIRFEEGANRWIDEVAKVAASLADAAASLSGEVAASSASSETMARSAAEMAQDFDGVAGASAQVADAARTTSGRLRTATTEVSTGPA